MIDTHGTPREELFVEDGLHLSEKGYRVWSDALKPYLLK
jgi:lysophospholipase L1-like esterase